MRIVNIIDLQWIITVIALKTMELLFIISMKVKDMREVIGIVL